MLGTHTFPLRSGRFTYIHNCRWH